MEEKPRIEVLTTPSNHDGVRLQVENVIVKNRDSFNFKMTELPHMEVAIETLKSGTADLLAMSAMDWEKNNVKGLEIVAFLPRKEPTWVMVSDDKPEYLPKNAIIVCQHELIKRQLLRMRSDFQIYSYQETNDLSEVTEKLNLSDLDESLATLENLRNDKIIDAYVISRGAFAQTKNKLRRHTLGMQKDKPTQEFERSRFIPPPLQGYSFLVSRLSEKESFKKLLSQINDEPTKKNYSVEIYIYKSLDEDIRDLSGLFVDVQNFKTIINKYAKLLVKNYNLKIVGDTFEPEDNQILKLDYVEYKRALKEFSEKDREKLKSGWKINPDMIVSPRFMMYYELLDKSGKVSVEHVRITPDFENMIDRDKTLFLKEIKFSLDYLQQEHNELKRQTFGLPEEYHSAKPGLLEL